MAQESDDVDLLTEVASLYYEENYTQEHIARLIGISRSSISRLLTRSRELGLVDIYVHHPLQTSMALREELMKQFALQDAQVLQCTSADKLALERVGGLAARYVERHILEHQGSAHNLLRTVGISWGTSLLEMLKALRPRRRFPLNIVQLVGSIDMSAAPEIDGPEIARRLADAYNGNCYYLHAPLLVADATVRIGLLKERSLRRTFQMMEQMDLAIVGIGGAYPSTSGLFQAGYLSESEYENIRGQGVVGDICGHYFTIDGALCATDILCRTMTVPFETLKNVPTVVAVAAGVAKTEAILGALRTGVVNVLVTDEQCARELLQNVASSIS